MKVLWDGVYPAVTTKFNADESLDFSGFENNLDAQIKAGIDGIIVGGSLGENSVLTTDEKFQLLESAKNASQGRVPVLLCVAECTTRDAIAFAQRSEKEGADGLMVLPPMRYPSDSQETLVYLNKVAASTRLPIMIYNNPLAYNIMVTPEMFEELAENHDHVEAIKESSGNIRYLTDLLNKFGDRYKILSGVDDLAMESMIMGASGWVAGLVNAFPRETVAIYQLVKAGRIAEAREIYRWFFPLLHLDVSTKLVQNIKLAEVATGLGTEYVRGPRLPLAGEEREEVLKIIQDGLASRPDVELYLSSIPG
ncbi:MAG: dihydrodipicolinate synthase family protein [Bacteroidetes bacterium]|nr:dihydrodipicolinate synthase family protein [Bacteroidota bacterium]